MTVNVVVKLQWLTKNFGDAKQAVNYTTNICTIIYAITKFWRCQGNCSLRNKYLFNYIRYYEIRWIALKIKIFKNHHINIKSLRIKFPFE